MGFWQRWRQGCRVARSTATWDRLAGPDWAERVMDLPVTDRFFAKQGRSIGRLVLTDGGERLVVYLKRHYELPWWSGALAALWPSGAWSPAWQEANNLDRARAEGFPVPRIAAAGQFLAPGGRLQSVLAVEELTEMLPLHEAIPLAGQRLGAEQFDAWKRGLIAEMVRLCRGLHDRRLFHKDLYLCHFYVPESTTRLPPTHWRERVYLIDLHRLRRHAWTWRWWQAKDLAQLLYSTDVEGVTARDRLRFWRLYSRDGGSPLARWLVRTRATNYTNRNRRKPQTPGLRRPAA